MSLIVLDDDSSDELETASDPEPGPSSGAGQGTSGEAKSKHFRKQPLSVDEREFDDTETVDTADNSNDDEEKPLLDLMKQLINYNNKQNTKLTNNQLVGILKKEFGLDVANFLPFSLDIYMNVLKKFLKDWPQWDEFDQVMHETRCMNDDEEIERMLEREYSSLKQYLSTILEATKPFAHEATEKLRRSLEIPVSCRAVPGDVTLEINCTRDQLNTLFFRKPHPGYKSSIFNVDSSLPSKISLSNVSFQSMLHSCYVDISINMAGFKYKRECLHNFKHTLVNKKLRQLKRDSPLDSHLQQSKNIKTAVSEVNRNDLKVVIEKIQRSNRYSILQQYDVDTMFRTISEDLRVLPESFLKKIEVPSIYRHYLSKYPYVRYLYKDVEGHSEKYDLQLEEKISPMLKFHINKISINQSAVNTDLNWLKLECTICQTQYFGVEGIDLLKAHFRETHQNELNWTCTNCDKEFNAMELAACRWHHRCENAEVRGPRLFS